MKIEHEFKKHTSNNFRNKSSTHGVSHRLELVTWSTVASLLCIYMRILSIKLKQLNELRVWNVSKTKANGDILFDLSLGIGIMACE